ncbi:hypothetical protein HID58_047786, partial [Brassica napus]
FLDGEDRVLDESEASHELFLHVRNLSVGAALIAVVHTLHGFRKRMLYYGVVSRDWFNKLIVQQFLLNTIPSRADILMHKLNVMFPSSALELRSMLPPKPLMSSKSF